MQAKATKIIRLYSHWAGLEQCQGGSFLTWAAWMATAAPDWVQPWMAEEYPTGEGGEFYQRFIRSNPPTNWS